MKPAAILPVLLAFLPGCVATPYYGEAVVEQNGRLVCGVHQIPVTAHEGYIFNGLMSGTEDFEFAARRYPNTRGPNFSDDYDAARSYTLRFTDHFCDECNQAHERLSNLPMCYKRIAEWPASVAREIQLERAREKADRTGNPDDARVRDGDGWISGIR